MVCRTTCTERGRAGLTLIEVMVALGVGSLVGLIVATMSFYSGRSFAAMANYVDLERQSQNALNILTRDVRQADALASCVTNNGIITALTLTYQGQPLAYMFDPTAGTLTRTDTNGNQKVLLKECDYCQFWIYQRNPVGGTYDQYPAATPATCKLVQVTWVCSRTILGAKVNTESVQSAKIVIRKE